MKKILLILVVAMLAAAAVQAKGPQGVSKTVHNLSSTSPDPGYRSTNEDEVCIYCHTPHGGSLSAPLWNRNLPGPADSFLHYSSATLLPALAGTWTTNRPVSTESLLCLSCHDGGVAMNSIINYSNSTGALPNQNFPMTPMFIGVGSIIGDITDASGFPMYETRNLSDDHPISFSFYDVYNAGSYDDKLHTISYAEGKGVRFFPTGGGEVVGGKRVECSSCHDPHVDYTQTTGNTAYAPFLITPNAGSNLCLACHVK